MVLILPKVKSFGEEIGGAAGSGLGQGMSEALQEKQDLANKLKMNKEIEAENEAIKRDIGIIMPKGLINPDLRKAFVTEQLKAQSKEKMFGQKQEFLSKILNRNQNVPQGTQDFTKDMQGTQLTQPGQLGQSEQQQGFDPLKITDEDILEANTIDRNMGQALNELRDTALKEKRHLEDVNRNEFEANRKYHTEFSKKAEDEVEGIRSNLSKKEMSLNLSRDAVESNEVGAFSLANLAQRLGIPEWQTMKGAQLETAIKENLLSNMSRVSAKGQNIWFEKRLNSMMAQIGKSEEANLAAQEILEGEVAMDRAYIENFDRLANEDMKNYNFVKKDISKRARDAAKFQEKDIFKRTSYRLKQLEEQEKGLQDLKVKVGKNVSKGTPLTLAMAKLYKDKYGEKALDVAEKNGYYIPTIEEFNLFQLNPQEFREGL